MGHLLGPVALAPRGRLPVSVVGHAAAMELKRKEGRERRQFEVGGGGLVSDADGRGRGETQSNKFQKVFYGHPASQ